MDTYKDAVSSTTCGRRDARRGGWERTASTVIGRSSPAPRASSAPGSRRRCSSAATRGLASTAATARRTRRSSCSGIEGERRPSSAATSSTRELVERGARRARGRHRLPPRRPDDRRRRPSARRCRPSRRTSAGPGRCSRPAARRASRASVVASSDKAYGAARRAALPRGLRAASRPLPYDVGKAAADLIARSYWHTYGLPVAVTRFANIYGGGDTNFSRLIPEAVSAALDGRAPVLRSDGSPERDFLYVEDAAAAYLAIADALDRDDVRAARRSTPAAGEPHRVARGGRADLPRSPAPRSSPTSAARAPGRRDRPPVRRPDEAARADSAGSPGSGSRRAFGARSSGTGSTRRPALRLPRQRPDLPLLSSS